MSEFSDEMLMRFADGELDAATTETIAAAIDQDESLARRVAMFADTRNAARLSLAPMLDEPVPEHLQRSIEAMITRHQAEETAAPASSNVVTLAERRPQRATNWYQLAAAACVAAVLGGIAGYGLKPGATANAGFQVGDVLDPGLAVALSAQRSGEQLSVPGGEFRAIASFRDGQAAFCREFELIRSQGDTIVSVACRAGTNWQTRFAVLAPRAEDSYAPASSIEAMEAYLEAMGGVTTLSVDQEKAALEDILQEGAE